MIMPIKEPVLRPESLLLPLPLPLPLLLPPPEDEESEVDVEDEAMPKMLSVFVAAAPVGKSISIGKGMLVCWYTLAPRTLGPWFFKSLYDPVPGLGDDSSLPGGN
jgi:hypothetical protein